MEKSKYTITKYKEQDQNTGTEDAMKKIPSVLIYLTALVFVASCGGGGGGGGDTTPALSVSETLPALGAVKIPATNSVSANFSKEMDSKTVNSSTFLVDSSSGPVSGRVVCTGSTASFFPDSPLQYRTIYTARITTSAESLDGSTLGTEYSWSFTTVKAGPGDPNNYIPFDQGNTWTYQGTITQEGFGPQSYTNVLSVDGTTVVDNVTATIFVESNPGNLGEVVDAYLNKDLNGITNYGSSSLDELTKQITPFQQINFTDTVGYSFVQVHKADLDFGDDIDGDMVNETFDILSLVTIVGFETVSVPVGDFNNCIHIKTEIQIVVKGSTDSTNYNFITTENSWYAPSVGPIKNSIVFVDFEGSEETTEESLVGWFSILATDLAAADSNTESPGRPAVGYDGTNFLVVTREVLSPSDSNMLGALVDGRGVVLQEFDISVADTGSSNRSAVANDGSNYLVVFGQTGQIAGQRITSAGQLLDGPSGFAITSTESNAQPAVAFDGNNYLVVWGKYIGGSYDIYGARITPEGQLLGEFPIFAGAGEQIFPAISYDGNNYLVVWQDTRSGSSPSDDTDIYATRVTPNGVVLDPLGRPICTVSGYQGAPSLTFDNNNYFAVWEDGRAYSRINVQLTGVDIFGARITKNGTVLDTSGIPINSTRYMDFNGKANPTVTFDGTDFFVSWQTGSFSIDPPAGIFAARVSSDGEIVDPGERGDGIPLSGPPPTDSRYVYPVVKAGIDNILTTWINNNETSGASKDIRGALIPSL